MLLSVEALSWHVLEAICGPIVVLDDLLADPACVMPRRRHALIRHEHLLVGGPSENRALPHLTVFGRRHL